MKKKYRVKKETEFQKVFHSGESKANKQFVIYKLEKTGQDYFRVGISVGKKLGNAVMRNRIKRQIRASVHHLQDQIMGGLDLIIIARAPTVEMTQQQMEKSLLHVLSLSNALKE